MPPKKRTTKKAIKKTKPARAAVTSSRDRVRASDAQARADALARLKLLERRMRDYDKLRSSSRETRMSRWMRDNKTLLVTSGLAATAFTKAVQWLCDHTEQIREFAILVRDAMPSPGAGKYLDVDALRIGDEPIYDAVSRNDLLLRAVLSQLVREHGFVAARSNTLSEKLLRGIP